MKNYYLESSTWQISGKLAGTTLCQNEDGEINWKQDFEMAFWNPMKFTSTNKALEYVRNMYKENGATQWLNEIESKILYIANGETQVHETGIRITTDPQD